MGFYVSFFKFSTHNLICEKIIQRKMLNLCLNQYYTFLDFAFHKDSKIFIYNFKK